ncbi:MAG: hypothetical protein GY810_24800 [Aureispira sp.]|nr:hypothetical protein [Aureispira sp.]
MNWTNQILDAPTQRVDKKTKTKYEVRELRKSTNTTFSKKPVLIIFLSALMTLTGITTLVNWMKLKIKERTTK